MLCVNISIVSDSILESDESFLVDLTTDDSAIILSPSMATIDILNDDSKDEHSICPCHFVCVRACIDYFLTVKITFTHA